MTERWPRACGCAGENPLPIVYGRSRYPFRPRKSRQCLGCGAPVPPRRKTWCCNPCFGRFEPASVLQKVKERDKEVCAVCGYCRLTAWRNWNEDPKLHAAPAAMEYDHIVPFSEGGLTVLENMRTLCRQCHKKRTAAWRRERALNSKEGAA
jgi:5-methylcytosine-specific restriction endonuclease McrA